MWEGRRANLKYMAGLSVWSAAATRVKLRGGKIAAASHSAFPQLKAVCSSTRPRLGRCLSGEQADSSTRRCYQCSTGMYSQLSIDSIKRKSVENASQRLWPICKVLARRPSPSLPLTCMNGDDTPVPCSYFMRCSAVITSSSAVVQAA